MYKDITMRALFVHYKNCIHKMFIFKQYKVTSEHDA